MSDEKTWEIGPGWFQLVRDLEEKLAEVGAPYEMTQCKEKFGALRYYVDFPDMDHPGVIGAQRYIDLFETGSAFVCEDCGMYGRPRMVRHWWKTECLTHFEERKARRLGNVD